MGCKGKEATKNETNHSNTKYGFSKEKKKTHQINEQKVEE